MIAARECESGLNPEAGTPTPGYPLFLSRDLPRTAPLRRRSTPKHLAHQPILSQLGPITARLLHQCRLTAVDQFLPVANGSFAALPTNQLHAPENKR